MTVKQLKNWLNNLSEECEEYDIHFYNSFWQDEHCKYEFSRPINEAAVKSDKENKKILLAEIFNQPKPKEFYTGISITNISNKTLNV